MYGFPCANVDVDNYRHSTLFEKKNVFGKLRGSIKTGFIYGQYKRWTADCGLRTADWV